MPGRSRVERVFRYVAFERCLRKVLLRACACTRSGYRFDDATRTDFAMREITVKRLLSTYLANADSLEF